MKIVLAPNAFKDCMTSPEAATAMEKGIKKVFPEAETVKVPVADGGDGLIDSLCEPLAGKRIKLEVTGPRFNKINSEYCILPKQKTAIIEMAKASGLALLKSNERDAALTTSLGTGELIKNALTHDIDRLLIGIGGSATNDAGTGILHALGCRFLDEHGQVLDPIGKNLVLIKEIDTKNVIKSLSKMKIEIVCDVDNPLYGPKGAAYIYAPQKGADQNKVKELDSGLRNFSEMVYSKTNIDISKVPGGGAAGGIGAGLYGLLNAKLRGGIDIVLELVKYKEKLANADLVLTAEGQIDHQTAFGKAPAGAAKLAKKENIPCIAIAGSIGKNISNLHDIGINAVFSLCPGPVTLEDAIKHGNTNLTNATEQVVRTFFAKR